MAAYREHAPPPAFTSYIECFWSRTRLDDSPSLILPDGCVDILFTSARGLEVVGLMTTAKPSIDPSGTRYFGLRFHPAMAAAFLPEAALLTDRVVALDDLWKPSTVRRLEQRVDESDTPAAICSILEALPPPRLVAAGASERHHRRRYRQASGVSPKFMQRVLRFRRASEAARRLPASPNWAQFAAAHGYFDQAHFIREFQEFSGATPGRFLQSQARPSLVA